MYRQTYIATGMSDILALGPGRRFVARDVAPVVASATLMVAERRTVHGKKLCLDIGEDWL